MRISFFNQLDLIDFSLISVSLFAVIASLTALSMAGHVDQLKARIRSLENDLRQRTVDLDRLDIYFPEFGEQKFSNETKPSSAIPTDITASHADVTNHVTQTSGIFKPNKSLRG